VPGATVRRSGQSAHESGQHRFGHLLLLDATNTVSPLSSPTTAPAVPNDGAANDDGTTAQHRQLRPSWLNVGASASSALRSCCWSPDGSQLAVGTADGAVCLVTVDSDSITDQAHSAERNDSLDHSELLVAKHDGMHLSALSALAWSGANQEDFIVSCDVDGLVAVWCPIVDSAQLRV
jgi:WD40 repeat protein